MRSIPRFVAMALASLLAPLALAQQTPLPGSSIPQFAHALPTLSVAGGAIG